MKYYKVSYSDGSLYFIDPEALIMAGSEKGALALFRIYYPRCTPHFATPYDPNYVNGRYSIYFKNKQ